MDGRGAAARRVSGPAGIVMASALLVAACSGGGPTSPASGPSGGATGPAPSPSAAPVVRTAPPPTPVPTNAAGIRTCVSASDGPEVECALDAGVYATEFFQPPFVYTVPSTGWSSLDREVSPGNFHLFPPGGSLDGFERGTTDAITVLAAVAPPGHCTGEPSTTLPATFKGLFNFLTTNPHLSVMNVRDVTVGGLEGKALDIAFKEQDGCGGMFADTLVGITPSHGAFSVTPEMAGARLYLLHLPGSDAAFVIEIDDGKDGGSDYGDGDDWYGVAQDVVDSFVIST